MKIEKLNKVAIKMTRKLVKPRSKKVKIENVIGRKMVEVDKNGKKNRPKMLNKC